MTIPSRPAPPPPTQQQQQQQQHNVGGFNNITTTSHIGIIKLPPPPTSLNKKSYQCNSTRYDKTTTSSFRSTDSSSSTVSSSSSSSSSITRKFPIAKTRNINGTVQSCYNDPFEIISNTVENSINMKKKIPPPRPPPPKQSVNNYGAIDTVLKKPGGPPQSISKLTNIFGKKKNNNTKTFGKQNFQQQQNQQQQIYQQQQLPPNKFPPLSTNAATIKSNISYQSRPYAFVPPLVRNSNETELISFDSPPNSPSLKKSNSDCNSVNSYSYSSASDSNFGSPNTGSLATQSAESGFEDDFVSPPDPWESLLINDPFKDSNDFKNISQPVRNLNTINNLKGDDLLSNGKSLLPPPSTLAMPTIIKPKTSSSSSLLQSSSLSSQKRILAPKPPIYLQKPGGEPEELLETDESILNDSSPPMPNCPPPPPPLEVFNSINILTVDEVPQWINNYNAIDNDDDSTDPSQASYGIALYTFDGLEEGDLPFKENEKVYILDKLNENWYFGRNKRGCEGIFPSNYIQIKVPFKKNPNQNDNNSTIRESIENMNNDNNQKNHHQNQVLNCKGRSLYNFVAEVPEDLSLNENDIINVLYRINDDWLYGEIGNRKGQFPANFIEFI